MYIQKKSGEGGSLSSDPDVQKSTCKILVPMTFPVWKRWYGTSMQLKINLSAAHG